MKPSKPDFSNYRHFDDALNREACLNNISNFCFLVECFLSNHPEKKAIQESLKTYLDKPSFSISKKDGKITFRANMITALSRCLEKTDYEFVTKEAGVP